MSTLEVDTGGDMDGTGGWGRIILTPEASSSRFHDKVLVLRCGESVTVTRSSSDEKPDTDNAVFDCRVGTILIS